MGKKTKNFQKIDIRSGDKLNVILKLINLGGVDLISFLIFNSNFYLDKELGFLYSEHQSLQKSLPC